MNILVDLHSNADSRGIDLDRVGVKNLTHPIQVLNKNKMRQATVATFDLSVNLPATHRGTHMSRFVEILNHREWVISLASISEMLTLTTHRLDAEFAHLEVAFPFFIMKTSPVTKSQSLMDYQVTFLGTRSKNQDHLSLKVQVPVTTLCPCSKEISAYGAHNQRTLVTTQITVKDSMPLEDLIQLIESKASAEIYGIVKRPDEKFITELAYDNPKFVEDMVRDIAIELNNDPNITQYSIEAESIESIHNHSAYAKLEKSKVTQSDRIKAGHETNLEEAY